MSHDHQALHREIRALRRTRAQLESLVHPIPAAAQEQWEELERRWSDVENYSKNLTRETEDALDDVRDRLREDITELREGYDRLASALREPRSDSLWVQVRNSFDPLVGTDRIES
jgi:DNA repair exonuclease SbcCD ATPase subunit